MTSDNAFLILLVGLSCSGKSTISEILEAHLHKAGVNITRVELDTYIKKNFPKEGFVFDIETRLKLDGIISEDLKEKTHQGSSFILDAGNSLASGRQQYIDKIPKTYVIYVDTPLITCILRDCVRSLKGKSPISNWIYFKAFKSKLLGDNRNLLQGVNIPFEKPATSDLVIKSSSSIDSAVQALTALVNTK